MKRIATVLLAAAFAILGSTASADLVITEVVDGNRIASDGSAGSNPDPFLAFMELTNTGASAISLDGFHYINFNNGADMVGFGSTALTGTLEAGETYYIAYESGPSPTSAFDVTYGGSANEYTGSKFINGDDVLLLLDAAYVANTALDASSVVDVYGVVGVDGSGQDWEYLDTVAQRIGTTANGGTFDVSDWSIQATNFFDGQDAAFHAANTSVTLSTIPEPTAGVIALGLAALGFTRRRR